MQFDREDGFWSFDSKDDFEFPGNLLVDEKISLNLFNCNNAPEESFPVFGITVTGKKITLLDCYISNRKISHPGFSRVIIFPTYCFIGEHFDNNHIIINKASFSLSDLSRWIDIRSFEVDCDFSSFTYKTELKLPEKIVFYESADVTFSIQFSFTAPMAPLDTVEINQNSYIVIESKKGFDMKGFWSYLSLISSFFTFSYFSQPKIENIVFNIHGSTSDIKFTYLGQNDFINFKPKKHRNDFVFSYHSLKDDFKAIFSNWRDLNEKAKPVIDSMQESFGRRTILVENKFLNIIHAIETFHRRYRKNEKESKELHKKKKEEIIDSVPVEYKQWLSDKLHFSNEPTLNDRLLELFNEIDKEIKNNLFRDNLTMIKQAKDSRNYYTHYDKSLEKKRLKGEELSILTQRLRIFLLILFLKEVGFKLEEINNIVNNSSRNLYNHLIF